MRELTDFLRMLHDFAMKSEEFGDSLRDGFGHRSRGLQHHLDAGDGCNGSWAKLGHRDFSVEREVPSGKLTYLLKMTIYRGFTH
jgi:hypothetical protein